MEQELRALADELHVPVQFQGKLAAAAVKQHLDQARVCCLPSVTAQNGDAEGLGMVLLEAQACGVPVVTSARGGVSDAIRHGETGFAVPERDTAALAHFLTKLLSDDALTESMSRAAVQFVAANFDIHQCTAALEDWYDSISYRR